MKKMVAITAIAFIIISVIAVADGSSGDIVNISISSNGTFNSTIIVNTTDSQVRDDLYGNTTGSGPKDMLLDEISAGYGNPISTAEGIESISQICSDPFLNGYLNSVSSLPPSDFVNYLKGLGYDDEAHVNFIWTICQQEYINQNQDAWSSDSGMLMSDLLSVMGDAVTWLRTGNGMTLYSKEIADMLSSYFASKDDIGVIVNKISQQDLRIQALERAMEQIAPAAYCQGKLDLMNEYNLSGVKCGTNSTMYWNAKKSGFGDYDIISYTDCVEDWKCSGWSACSDGFQGRTCSDSNKCGSFEMMPEVSRECSETAASGPDKDYSHAERPSFLEYVVSSASSFFFLVS